MSKHRWNKRTSALAHAAKARKRMEQSPCIDPQRMPAGELLGVMQWHAADGTVRRWTVKQGQRMNGIRVEAKEKKIDCGWDHFFRVLRSKLAAKKAAF